MLIWVRFLVVGASRKEAVSNVVNFAQYLRVSNQVPFPHIYSIWLLFYGVLQLPLGESRPPMQNQLEARVKHRAVCTFKGARSSRRSRFRDTRYPTDRSPSSPLNRRRRVERAGHEERWSAQLPNTGHSASSITARYVDAAPSTTTTTELGEPLRNATGDDRAPRHHNGTTDTVPEASPNPDTRD